MAHRQFTDAAGVVWRVFETDPTAFPADWEHRAAMLHADFLGGWLTFASSGETRRLAPIPPSWSELPAEQLGLLCRNAKAEGADGDYEGTRQSPSHDMSDESRNARGL